MGGPVIIPHFYNGHDKTFFFFNWEEFIEDKSITFTQTLPNAAFRQGDFSSISPNGTCSACAQLGIPTRALPSKDPAGNPIFANTIYDPLTRNSVLGNASPFPGNIIPPSRLDPVSVKIQSLIPLPTGNSLINNGAGGNDSFRTTIIPALKVDQLFGSKVHLSGYWSKNNTDSQFSSPFGNADGLPDEISNARGTFFHYAIATLNLDYTVSPTVLFHIGGSYSRIRGFDDAPFLTFNAQKELGLSGFEQNRNFPFISALTGVGSQALLGGVQNLGTSLGIQGHPIFGEPSFNANLTVVRGNHTYKIGTEVYFL
jgi:hypothetical protein